MHIGDAVINWYSMPPLIAMFFMLSLAVVSLVSGRNILVWKMLAIFALLLCMAAFFAFKVSISTTDAQVFKYVRHAPFFALMSVLFAVYYSMILTGKSKRVELFFHKVSLKNYIIFVAIIGGIILATLLKTGLIIKNASISISKPLILYGNPMLRMKLSVFLFCSLRKFVVFEKS